MYSKNRGVIKRGENHAQSKVSMTQAIEIRRLAGLYKQRQVAERLDLSDATISRVVNNTQGWFES